MIRTLKLAMDIAVSSNVNWLLFYLKKIPLVGRIFKDVEYFSIASKRVIALIILIVKMIFDATIVLVYAGLLIWVPMVFLEGDVNTKREYFLHIFFVLYIVFNLFLNCYTLELKRMKFICVKLMRMNAYDYTISQYFFKRLWHLVGFVPTIIGFSLLFGGTVIEGIILCFISKMVAFVGESVHLYYFKRTYKILHKNYIFMLCGMFALLALAYVPLLLEMPIPIGSFLFHPVNLLFVTLIGVGALIYILRYDLYKEGINQSHQLSDLASISIDNIQKESQFADVKLKEKGYKEEELHAGRFSDKSGYEYLNALFFDRHKRKILKAILLRVIILILFFVGIIIISKYTTLHEYMEQIVLRIYPLTIFAIYYLSLVIQKAIRAMFYNCDSSLLHYGFYKKGGALLKMFRLRLNYLAGFNMLPALTMGLGFLVYIYLYLPHLLNNMRLYMVYILLLSLFFTVHHIFLYYILQPYTCEYGLKSPTYSIVNTITYMLCFWSLYIRTTPTYFVLIIMLATIIYIVLAIVLIYKFASKTFVVK